MNPDSILLLGGDGFIGTALARHLSHNGYSVNVVSRHLSEDKPGPGISRHRGDLADRDLILKLLPACGTIVHLAACTTPGVSARAPAMEAALNLQPALQFLELLGAFENRHLIFISSGGTLYGNPAKIPADEAMVLQPRSYHGAGKLATEIFLQTFTHLTGQRVTILRPSNIYGPGQHFQSGFGVIRTICEHLRNGTEMEIWGDGTCVRDFLFIDDVTRAIEAVIRLKPGRRVYNLGSGSGDSLNAVIEMIESVSNRRLKRRHLPQRALDVKAVILDASRFRRDTGWKPAVMLREGIQETWNWLMDGA